MKDPPRFPGPDEVAAQAVAYEVEQFRATVLAAIQRRVRWLMAPHGPTQHALRTVAGELETVGWIIGAASSRAQAEAFLTLEGDPRRFIFVVHRPVGDVATGLIEEDFGPPLAPLLQSAKLVEAEEEEAPEDGGEGEESSDEDEEPGDE